MGQINKNPLLYNKINNIQYIAYVGDLYSNGNKNIKNKW